MSSIAALEPHRPALYGHCYRMLGSATDADDAVQDTLLKAWQGYAKFDHRSKVSTWLYRIATHVCIDRLRQQRRRRELPVRAGPAGTVDDPLLERPARHWLEPVPDRSALPPEASPEEKAALRQQLRLAFVAALQRLPPKQRAALLLREVLDFSAEEIAETLDTSVAAVNSALQRARKTLADASRLEPLSTPALTEAQTATVDQYVDAFHRYDIPALVDLLAKDGTMCMPPYTLWLEGQQAVHDWMLGRGIACRGSRLVPVEACGSPAFAQYKPTETSSLRAWSLIVLEMGPNAIDTITHFLDVEALFPLFGLELEIDLAAPDESAADRSSNGRRRDDDQETV